MEKPIKAQAILSRLQTLADGTTRVMFDLNEDKEASKKFIENIQKFGIITFTPEA